MMMRSFRSITAAAAVLPMLALTVLAVSQPIAPAVADSMGPVKVAGLGLGNFGVVDSKIYRGEQPKQHEYRQLAALGVTTLIDLRDDPEVWAQSAAEAAGLEYVNISIDAHGRPNDAVVLQFLETLARVASSNPNGRTFVHCAGGRHRTGSMLAVYRLVRNGWSAERAYREMKAYDYYSRWGHGGHKDYVFEYYERMRREPTSVPVAYEAQAPPVSLGAAPSASN